MENNDIKDLANELIEENDDNIDEIELEEEDSTNSMLDNKDYLNSQSSNFSGFFHERDSLTENNIVNEVSSSFLDYSMSVITARAIPDLRDGLKPVNRRILWSMYESGYTPDKPHKKSAKTVGEVMGNYHPHGDSSIYEAMVRMAQDFNYRHMLIDGHGNFGNIEGDGAAAMRYTESRLSKISLELLRDIKKDTVDMEDNFDFTRKEPKVLPSRYPNILVNGSMGIAVGMATNIPPHNLGEVIDGCVAYIDNPEIDTTGLMEVIKGPDFPTGGVILGNRGIREAYETGRGSITIRSKASIIEENGKNQIIIDEVPYGVNTFELKNKVAELVHNKVIDGISDYHTDLKNGIKITITLKKDANASVVLNKLYKHTNFQLNYGIIFLMLDNGVPRTLGLKSIISKYIDHQKEVIIRRTKYDLAQAEARVHILEGLKIALDNIDEVVHIIRHAADDDAAKTELMERFMLDDIQATSILDMRLRRLTNYSKEEIENELTELIKTIEELQSILASEHKVLNIIKEELLEIKKKYAEERRTSIDMTAIDYIEDEALIPNDSVVISITNNGYVKRCLSDTFKSQKRGGVGVKGMSTNEEDYVKFLTNTNNKDFISFFTSKGKVYRIKAYEIPEYSRTAKGLPVINLLPIDKDETISAILSVNPNDDNKFVVLATKNGVIKKTKVEEYFNIRKSGKIAINLRPDDELISAKLSTGNNKILIGSSEGRMVVFNENEVRPMGRTSTGVRGISLPDSASCIGMEVGNDNDNVLVVTEKGYGKKTFVSEYRVTKRGSKGVKALNVTDKNGHMITHKIVTDQNDLMIITDSGMLIRIHIKDISQLGRVTQGVKLINLKDNQTVSNISIVNLEEDISEEEFNNISESTSSNSNN